MNTFEIGEGGLFFFFFGFDLGVEKLILKEIPGMESKNPV